MRMKPRSGNQNGESHWKNGTSGTKSEYKKNLKDGNSNHYTKVYNEKKICNVNNKEQRIHNMSYNKGSSSGKKHIINGEDDHG